MRLSRRDLVLSAAAGAAWLAAAPRAGLAQPLPVPAAPPPIIDVHAHVFNARDVPILGFLQQVILRDPHTDPGSGTLSTAALKLLKFVLLSDAPSPAEELAEFAGGPPVSPRLEAPLAEDQRAVARGIARFREELGRETAGLSTTRSEEEELLDRIEAELGLDPAGLSGETGAEELAALIYARPSSDAAGFFRDSVLIQTIKWAGLLTRRRAEILDRLVALYGGDGRTRVFVPALVDFELWFQSGEAVSPIRDQVAVMAALARRRRDAVVLNFAPYCPLRGALEMEAGRDPLDTLKWAVGDMGFAGVKLYPPLGFAPHGNDGAALAGLPRAPAGGGAALDAALEVLYAWCVENDVPVMAHANNSIDAGVCTGLGASPTGWRPVLERHELRLNMAHFGGFSEEHAAAFCVDPVGVDWERHAAQTVAAAPGAYVDLSYWAEATLPGNPRRAEVVGKLAALLAEFPVLKERMLYGSDWTMLGREPRHEGYLDASQSAFAAAGLDEAERAAVLGGNARRYLGLHRKGLQHERLARFFGPGHPFEALFPV